MKSINFDSGVFILSLDFELAWGSFDLWGDPDSMMAQATLERCRKTRERVIDGLLKLFKIYDISASWGIVGHLFLDGCDVVNGVKHCDMPRPTHKWFPDDWYAYDPAVSADENSVWYGRDLVEKIKEAEPGQEIGCHTFSHVIFGDDGCTKRVAEAEVKKCVALAQEMEIELKSFIFPRHMEGYYEVLQAYGFTAYRAGQPGWNPRVPGQHQRWLRYFADFLGLTPPTAVPKEKLPGLWAIPVSAYFRPAFGYGRLIPMRSRIRQVEKGIQKAMKNMQIFHLFLHPSNFGYRVDYMLDGLAHILKFAAQKRQAGDLNIMTMGQLAAILTQEQEGLLRHKYDAGGFQRGSLWVPKTE